MPVLHEMTVFNCCWTLFEDSLVWSKFLHWFLSWTPQAACLRRSTLLVFGLNPSYRAEPTARGNSAPLCSSPSTIQVTAGGKKCLQVITDKPVEAFAPLLMCDCVSHYIHTFIYFCRKYSSDYMFHAYCMFYQQWASRFVPSVSLSSKNDWMNFCDFHESNEMRNNILI